MKTKMNFLKSGLMALALVCASCSKDSVEGPTGPTGLQGEQGLRGEQGVQGDPGPAGVDGEALGVPGPQGDVGATGPQGPAGPKGDTGAAGAQGLPGTDGQDGQNGQDGEDGSLGARSVLVNPLVFSDDTYFETAVSIASDEVVFGYIQSRLDTGQPDPGAWYAIPTPQFVGFHFVNYAITTRYDSSSYRFDMFELDGSLKFIPPGRSMDINALKLVIITVNSETTAKATLKETILSQLDRNQVDINDYDAVSKYFGIAED